MGGEGGRVRAEAVARLFREHNRSLVSYLVMRLRSLQEAKEVAQEAYVRLLQLDQPGAESFLRAYLFKVATNVAVDRLRQRGRRQRYEEDVPTEDLETGLEEPGRQTLVREQLGALIAGLEELPEKCRTAFLLYRLDGLSQQEIARQLGVSDRMVRAYYAVANGEVGLWLYELASRQCRRLGAVKIRLDGGKSDAPQWSPDGRTLFVPAVPRHSFQFNATERDRPAAGTSIVVETSPEKPADGADRKDERRWAPRPDIAAMVADIVAVDVLSGAERVLISASETFRPGPSLRLSHSGRWLTFPSNYYILPSGLMGYSLYAVPTSGGEPIEIATDLPYSGRWRTVQHAWSPTEDKLALIKEGKLWEVDPREADHRQMRLIASNLSDPSNALVLYRADGKSVILGTGGYADGGLPGSKFRGVASVSLVSGVVRSLTDESMADGDHILQVVRYAGQRNNVLWEPRPGSLALLLRNREGRAVVRRIDMKSGATSVMVEGYQGYRSITVPERGSTVFAVYEDLSTPENLFQFAKDFQARKQLTELAFAQANARRYRHFNFETIVPSFDGRTESVRTAVILPPKPRPGVKPPAVVTFYPQDQVSEAVRSFAGGDVIGLVPNFELLEQGFAVILPDIVLPPYGRTPRDTLKDITDALLPQVYKAVDIAGLDVHRLAIAGSSFGGYGAIGVAIALEGALDASPRQAVLFLPRAGNQHWLFSYDLPYRLLHRTVAPSHPVETHIRPPTDPAECTCGRSSGAASP